jgi:PAS domain S-box-containing protein
MSGRNNAEIRELKARIAVLEKENMLLIDRSEDIFLLGTVVECLSGTDDFAAILENTLERVSLLKDIPCAVCCQLESGRSTVIDAYYSKTGDDRRTGTVVMSEELTAALLKGRHFVRLDECNREALVIRINGTELVPCSAILIPFSARTISRGYFLFADTREGESDRLEAMAPLLERAVEIAVTRLNLASMLAELQEANAALDEKVHARTKELSLEIDERRTIEMSLRDSEERLMAIWNNVRAGIMLIDPATHTITDVNLLAVEMIGLPREEIVGTECFRFVCPAEKEKGPITDLRQEVDNSERVLITADGTEIPILKTAATISINGQEMLVESFVDLTERKVAEEMLRKSLDEKEVLLKEVHHRVKNNLQVISGLLNIQASYIQDRVSREYFKESQNRVRTMALIHEELYQVTDLAHVDFSEFVEHLAGNLFESYCSDRSNISLRLDVEDARLVVDTAIPCGLIVNELISNSLKHAFPNGREGEISIRFHRNSEGQFSLEVEDNGVGLPEDLDPAATTSLGMQLINILSEQLGGEHRVYTDGGTRYVMRFEEYREAGTELY